MHEASRWETLHLYSWNCLYSAHYRGLAQVCNRWLTLRMQLISVATQLFISFMVLVLRWPSDPGETLLRRAAVHVDDHVP